MQSEIVSILLKTSLFLSKTLWAGQEAVEPVEGLLPSLANHADSSDRETNNQNQVTEIGLPKAAVAVLFFT